MSFKPLGKRVLAKRSEESATTATGIIIPDNAKEKPQQGEVVAISAEISNDKNYADLKVGSKIVFGKYSGSELKIDGQEFVVLNADDIFGVL